MQGAEGRLQGFGALGYCESQSCNCLIRLFPWFVEVLQDVELWA